MLNEQATQSTEEQDGASTGSVFDFLYYDSARVASFLSQFDPSGHLTGLTHTELVEHKTTDTAQVDAKGGFAPFAQAGGAKKQDNLDGHARSGTRTYDPRWANALAFLDYVDEKGIIERDMTAASIGQIVLFSGNLAVFDLGIIKGIWGLPAIKKAMLSGVHQPLEIPEGLSKQQKRQLELAEKSRKESALKEAEAAIEMISILPHMTEAALTSEDLTVSAWFTLSEGGMTVPTANLFLKHGLAIPGKWSVLAIMDAHPETTDDITMFAVNQLLAGSHINAFTQQMGASLVGPIKLILGRPMGSFGLTPLLLFRQVAAK